MECHRRASRTVQKKARRPIPNSGIRTNPAWRNASSLWIGNYGNGFRTRNRDRSIPPSHQRCMTIRQTDEKLAMDVETRSRGRVGYDENENGRTWHYEITDGHEYIFDSVSGRQESRLGHDSTNPFPSNSPWLQTLGGIFAIRSHALFLAARSARCPSIQPVHVCNCYDFSSPMYKYVLPSLGRNHRLACF
jgi:hypothetical protein